LNRFDPVTASTWDDAAMNALLLFLPNASGQYVCRPFNLNHYRPMINTKDYGVDGTLKMLRSSVNSLIDLQFNENGIVSRNSAPVVAVTEAWRQVGFYARMFGSQVCPASMMSSTNIADHVHGVLVRKQMDYGHENIRRFGRVGLIVRIQDKVARLENLVARGATDDPKNESITDNVVDVMGYASIGLMWEAGSFLLPLREIA